MFDEISESITKENKNTSFYNNKEEYHINESFQKTFYYPKSENNTNEMKESFRNSPVNLPYRNEFERLEYWRNRKDLEYIKELKKEQEFKIKIPNLNFDENIPQKNTCSSIVGDFNTLEKETMSNKEGNLNEEIKLLGQQDTLLPFYQQQSFSSGPMGEIVYGQDGGFGIPLQVNPQLQFQSLQQEIQGVQFQTEQLPQQFLFLGNGMYQIVVYQQIVFHNQIMYPQYNKIHIVLNQQLNLEYLQQVVPKVFNFGEVKISIRFGNIYIEPNHIREYKKESIRLDDSMIDLFSLFEVVYNLKVFIETSNICELSSVEILKFNATEGMQFGLNDKRDMMEVLRHLFQMNTNDNQLNDYLNTVNKLSQKDSENAIDFAIRIYKHTKFLSSYTEEDVMKIFWRGMHPNYYSANQRELSWIDKSTPLQEQFINLRNLRNDCWKTKKSVTKSNPRNLYNGSNNK